MTKFINKMLQSELFDNFALHYAKNYPDICCRGGKIYNLQKRGKNIKLFV